MLTAPKTRSRLAFTLVELLVVIAIIAILMSLLVVGVMKYLGKATDTKCSVEIGQLSTAMGAFKTHFGVYPPSKIRLLESGRAYSGTGTIPATPYYDLTVNGSGAPNNPVDSFSVYYLQKFWPRLSFSNTGFPAPVDWNGDGAFTNGDWTLEGDQCLVFFLGGIPNVTSPGCLGFASSPTNPSPIPPPPPGSTRIGPYFNFETNRLYLRVPGIPFYSYFDPYFNTQDLVNSKPYAYFSSGKTINSYHPGACAGINAKPYYMPGSPAVAGTRYHNQDTFQIISAGLDRKFGLPSTAAGVLWDPAYPAANLVTMPDPAHPGQILTPAFDDRTNFNTGILGAGN